MVLALRNRELSGQELERIGKDRRWTSHHAIRRGVVSHRRAPVAMARNLLPHLYWKDWLELAVDPAANPVVRRQAEKLLLGRLHEMSTGEHTALARRASRGVIPQLTTICGDAEPAIVDALMSNPRLVELDLVQLCQRADSSGPVLDRIALHTVWGKRRGVRLELLRRKELPISTLLGIARRIDKRDLQPLIEDDRVPPIVRVALERRRDGDTPARS